MPLITDATEGREILQETRERGAALINLNPECSRGIEACLRAAKSVGERVGADDLPIFLSICGVYHGRPQIQYYTSTNDPIFGFLCWHSDLAFYTSPDGPFGKIRVLTHLDHGQPEGDKAILENHLDKLTSVMFDASTLAFEDNMAQTARYVERFGKRVIVEGAVDEIFESGTGEQKNQITTVAQAKRYIEKTGVDLIVPNLGTEHRASARELRYHTQEAREISAAVGKTLVLHGTSSLSPTDFKHLKDDGIMKVNIWTAIEKAGAQGAVRKVLEQLGNTFPEADLREMQRQGILGPRCFEADYVQKTCAGRLWPKLDYFAEAVRRDAWVAGAQAVVEGCLEDLGYGAFGR